jgi:GxxExxY protein
MYKQEGYDLVGAAIEVYNEMGAGLLEDVYQECLEKELTDRNIPFTSQQTLNIFYKGAKLTKYYRPDLYVHEGIVVELKAIREVGNNELSQLINYLKISNKQVGYLINFGHPHKLDWHRIVL